MNLPKPQNGFGFLLICIGMRIMDKQTLRNKIRNDLANLPLEFYQVASLTIKNKLLQESSIINGNTIGITISRKREVDTKSIIQSLWDIGKNVAIPKCNPKDRTMDFYLIKNFSQLETVYLDLQEPILEKTVYIDKQDIDVIIVPGVVFDYKGYRIGYGGGYYDRYLKEFQGTTISLAFQMQLVDQLPKETHDIPVHYILTEQERIDCNTSRKG